MATTRLINPIHNLTKTAHDIAYFLRKVSPETYAELLQNASDTYGYSYVFFWRNRVLELNNAIQEVKTKNSTEQALTWFREFISKEEGGWEENSANVILLRRVLKELAGYDAQILLSLQELRELKGLLLTAIDQRISAEETVNAEKQKLDVIIKQRQTLEQDMLNRHDELMAMQQRLNDQAKEQALLLKEKIDLNHDVGKLQQTRRTHVIVNEALREEIAFKQKEAAKKTQQLDEIEKLREQKQHELLDLTRTLLSPTDWQTKRINPQDLQEAKKVAETAVNIFVREKEAAEKKLQELKSLPKKETVVKTERSNRTINNSQAVSERNTEKETLCAQRSKLCDAVLKQKLEERYRMKEKTLVVKTEVAASMPAVTEAKKESVKPAVTKSEAFKARQANLNHLFKPATPADQTKTPALTARVC